ncbi:hypothetical protein QM480_04995 [Flectobacillus sp. DC10W]|uniref:Uncharacterized protein n=1 Tax=Flectobacillus longus TaxID=2984207 RepID=A0ABT6YKJ7_9BACT|nr:hypothetical protein [Flectobacillus longus]MDI9863668.1 hypothetical protein [Flectobacillus longus]
MKNIYYLLLNQLSTGIILNTDGQTFYCNNSNTEFQEYPYIELESYEAVEEAVARYLATHSNIEISIYDENKKFIKIIQSGILEPVLQKKTWWKFW